MGDTPDAGSIPAASIQCYNEIGTAAVLGSSMAEHSAVNRGVVGSSPTRGA